VALTITSTLANTLSSLDFDFDVGFPWVRGILSVDTSPMGTALWVDLDHPTR
jgi:hypothetical protein